MSRVKFWTRFPFRSGELLFTAQRFYSRKTFCPYQALQVPRTASQREIKAAYLELVKKTHPDAVSSPKNDEAFHAVSRAYQLIGNSEKRRNFDAEDSYRGQAAAAAGRPLRRRVDSHDSFSRYYELLSKHKGPLYMSNWKMAALIILAALLGGSIIFREFIRSRTQLKGLLDKQQAESEAYYVEALEKKKNRPFEEFVEDLKSKMSPEERTQYEDGERARRQTIRNKDA